MKILWCESFLKDLKKIRSVTKKEITALLKKYPYRKRIFSIIEEKEYAILKGYVSGGRTRLIVLFEKEDEKMIPITVVKKESLEGKNITAESFFEFFENALMKITKELTEKKFEDEEI